MKIKNVLPLLGLALLSTSPWVHSAIVIDFQIPAASTGASRLNFGTSIELNFAIDGSGGVTLDAVPNSSVTVQGAIDAINSWDGSVGTVSDANLFGTTFSLLATGEKSGADAGVMGDGQFGSVNGLLGISGDNASRIDGVEANREYLKFTLNSTSNPNLQLTMTEVVVGSQGGTDVAVSADATDAEFTNVTGTLNSNVVLDVSSSGLTIEANGVFGFTNDLAGAEVNGYGLDSFTLTATAVPEPATVTLLSGLASFGFLVWRRFRLLNRS